MRVEGPAEGAEVELEQVRRVELVDHPVPIAILDGELLDGLVIVLFVDLGLEQFVA